MFRVRRAVRCMANAGWCDLRFDESLKGTYKHGSYGNAN